MARKKSKRPYIVNITKIITCLSLAYTVSLTPTYAQQIITDGNTQTNLDVNGNVTNVSTQTIKGNNAFNSFSRFNVDAGKTVNLVVPAATDNLINVVTSETTNINGVLNSLKDGHVGGNVFLINPHGIIVGSQGIVNVGSLTAITPTQSFTDNFFDAPGQPNDAAVVSVLNGTVPINSSASVTNGGKINAITDVKIDSGNVTNNGDIYSGAVFQENNIAIGDVVNINTLEDGASLTNNGRNITIKASNSINNFGKIVNEAGNIALTSNNLIQDGLLQVSSGNNKLLVNPDGTIDPSSNIGATIAGGNINVDDIITANQTGGSINITASSISGNGTLKTVGGTGEIDITNNSSLNLITNQLISNGGGQPGNIIVNGVNKTADFASSDGTIKVVKQTGDGSVKDIDINNNNAFLTLANKIMTNGGDLNINAYDVYTANNNISTGGGNININANNIGNYGLTNITTNGGNIYYLANTDIVLLGTITTSGGNINLFVNRYINCKATINTEGKPNNFILNSTHGGIYLGGNVLVQGDIIQNAFEDAVVGGIVKSSNNYNISSNNLVKIEDYSQITTGKDLIIESSKHLDIQYVNITAGETFKVYAGTDALSSLSIHPNFITAKTLDSNFLFLNEPLYLNHYYLQLGNTDKMIFNGSNLNPTNINLKSLYLDLWGDISTIGNISITGPGATGSRIGFHNLKLQTLAKNPYLLINADGTIDPSSNIGATIAGGNINVNDVLTANQIGGNINITTTTITGKGTLKTVGGTGEIDITNNSSLNLITNKLISNGGGQPGSIIINGNNKTTDFPSDLNGIIHIVKETGSAGTGNINITNNTTSNVSLEGHIHAAGDVNITSQGFVNPGWNSITEAQNNLIINANQIGIGYGAVLAACNDLTLNPTNGIFIGGADITAGNLLTLNAGDITESGMNFFPNSIVAGSLSSDFMAQNGPIYLISNNDLTLGNTDNVIIGGVGLNPTDITLISATQTSAYGNITVSDDITLSSSEVTNVGFGAHIVAANDIHLFGNFITINEGSCLNAMNNLSIVPENKLELWQSDISAGAQVILNGGNIYDNGLLFNPSSITAGSFYSDFLTQNAPINIVSSEFVNLSNLDNIIIDGNPLNPTYITANTYSFRMDGNVTTGYINADVSNQAIIAYGANITTTGDINFNSNYYIVVGGESITTSSGSIYFTAPHIYLDGSLNTQSNQAQLIVKPDGTIDPSSNIGATIAGGTIYVSNVTTSEMPLGNVILNSPDIFGAGNINTSQSQSSILIHNQSPYNMVLNQLIADGGHIGQVIINGTPVQGQYGDITITQTPTVGAGPILVTNDTASNLYLNDNVTNAMGLVNMTTLGNISQDPSKLITGFYADFSGNNITSYFNVLMSTNVTSTGTVYLQGSVGNLTGNSYGQFYLADINANNIDITSTAGMVYLSNGTILGNVNLLTGAADADVPAEILLGTDQPGMYSDIAIGGNLVANATCGNIYFYGGSVGGDATFTAGANRDNRYAIALGRYRDLNIAGNLSATSPGYIVYFHGLVGGNTDLTSDRGAALLDVSTGANLNVNGAAFAFLGKEIAGSAIINAPIGVFFGNYTNYASLQNIDYNAFLYDLQNGNADQYINYLGNVNPDDFDFFHIGGDLNIDSNNTALYMGIVDGTSTINIQDYAFLDLFGSVGSLNVQNENVFGLFNSVICGNLDIQNGYNSIIFNSTLYNDLDITSINQLIFETGNIGGNVYIASAMNTSFEDVEILGTININATQGVGIQATSGDLNIEHIQANIVSIKNLNGSLYHISDNPNIIANQLTVEAGNTDLLLDIANTTNIKSSGYINIKGNVSDLTATSDDLFNFYGGTANSINAVSQDDATIAEVNVNGDVYLEAGNNTGFNLSSANNVILKANGYLNRVYESTVNGNLELLGNGAEITNSNLNNLNINVLGDVNLTNTTILGNLISSSSQDTLIQDSSVGSNADIDAAGNVTIQDSEIAGNLSINCNVDIQRTNVIGDIVIGHTNNANIAFFTANNVNINSANAATVSFGAINNDLTIQSGTNSSIIYVNGNTLNVNSAGGVALVNSSFTGDVSLYGAQGVGIVGSSGNNFVANSGTDFGMDGSAFSGNSSLTVNGNTDITNSSTGPLQLNSNGYINLSQININGDLQILANTNSDINANFFVAGNISAKSTGGNINLTQNNGNMNINHIETPNDIFLTTLNGIINDWPNHVPGDTDDWNDPPAIIGHNIYLNSSSSIGMNSTQGIPIDDYLDIQASGKLTANANDFMYLDIHGNLVDSSINTPQNVDIYMFENGIFNNSNLNANDVYISADYSINIANAVITGKLDADSFRSINLENITAEQLFISAGYNSIINNSNISNSIKTLALLNNQITNSFVGNTSQMNYGNILVQNSSLGNSAFWDSSSLNINNSAFSNFFVQNGNDVNITNSNINGTVNASNLTNFAFDNGFIGGNINVQAANNINISTTSGNINANSIQSNAGNINLYTGNGNIFVSYIQTPANVTLFAANSINDDPVKIPGDWADWWDNAHVIANNINITAGNMIGSNYQGVNYFDIQSNSIVTAQSGGTLMIDHHGNLNSNYINSQYGSALVYTFDGGNANIDYISAPETIYVYVSGPYLNIGTIDPASIFVGSETPGGSVNIGNAQTSGSLQVTADNSNVNNLINTNGAGGQLVVGVSGSTGLDTSNKGVLSNSNQASNVTVNLSSANGAVFDNLQTQNANLNNTVHNSPLVIANANIGNLNVQSDVLIANSNVNISNISATGTNGGTASFVLIENKGSININEMKANKYTIKIDSGTISFDNIVMDNIYQNSVQQNLAVVDQNTIDDITSSLKEREDNKTKKDSMLTLSDPTLYLDEDYQYILETIMNTAESVYEAAISDNLNEDEVNNKVSEVFEKANMNIPVAKKLLQKDFIKNNPKYIKLLEAFIHKS